MPAVSLRAPIRERVARSVTWIVWSRGAVQIVSLFSTLFVARLLSPMDYGLVGLTGIWTYALREVAELGLGSAIVQFRDVEADELNACFWLNMGIALAGYAALIAAAPWIATWLSTPALTPILRVGGLVLPLSALRTVPESLLRRALALERVSQAQLAASVVATPAVLGLALAGAGVWALVAGIVIMATVQSLATLVFARWYPGFHVGGRRLGEILRYGFASLGARLCWVVYLDADSLLLGKFVGAASVGLYAMAKQLATLPLEKIVVPVSQVLSPMLAELQDNREQMRRSAFRAIRFVAWLTFPIFGGFMLVADDLVRVVLTDKWLATTPAIAILCLFSMVRVVDMMLAHGLMAAYRPRFLFHYQLVLMLTLVPAFALGARYWGAPGVALAWVTVYPAVTIWMAREALRELRSSFRSLWAELQAPVAVTGVMILTLIALRHLLWPLPVEQAWGRLVLLVLTGALVYGVGLLLLGGRVRGEMRQLAGWLLQGCRPAASRT